MVYIERMVFSGAFADQKSAFVSSRIQQLYSKWISCHFLQPGVESSVILRAALEDNPVPTETKRLISGRILPRYTTYLLKVTVAIALLFSYFQPRGVAGSVAPSFLTFSLTRS